MGVLSAKKGTYIPKNVRFDIRVNNNSTEVMATLSSDLGEWPSGVCGILGFRTSISPPGKN